MKGFILFLNSSWKHALQIDRSTIREIKQDHPSRASVNPPTLIVVTCTGETIKLPVDEAEQDRVYADLIAPDSAYVTQFTQFVGVNSDDVITTSIPADIVWTRVEEGNSWYWSRDLRPA